MGMQSNRIYEIVPDQRLRDLEWRVRAWRTGAWCSLLVLVVPVCVLVLWLIGRTC